MTPQPDSHSSAERPLIMHVVYRFDVGGLENGIVNIINGLPDNEFQHAVVALTECSPEFSQRITRPGVDFVSLRKPPGHGWKLYRPAWRLFRQRRPAIVHTRNLSALEMQLPAALAGVPARIHGEHGWDMTDPHGEQRKFRLTRRAYSPFVTQYVAVSHELEQYLTNSVGIRAARVACIRNGVDDGRFAPARTDSGQGYPVPDRDRFVVGTVGRLDRVKGHAVLIGAVERLLARGFDRDAITIRIVGDGPLRDEIEAMIAAKGLDDVVEMLGARNDIADTMRQFDLFVLPSLAEGISNTVLEAMASGLPVLASAVGGNLELIEDGVSGTLVAPSDADALAAAIARYAESERLRKQHGVQARARVERELGIGRMLQRYAELYRQALGQRAPI